MLDFIDFSIDGFSADRTGVGSLEPRPDALLMEGMIAFKFEPLGKGKLLVNLFLLIVTLTDGALLNTLNFMESLNLLLCGRSHTVSLSHELSQEIT
jgi:hypothetical protein